MKLGVLLSGGKDSVFACMMAMQTDEVVCFITISSKNDESYMFHTPNIQLTDLQAKAAGIPLLEVTTEGIEEKELSDLSRAISLAREEYGIDGVVTGAILSVYQATRVQKICDSLGMWCFNPLWHLDQEDYMNELVEKGFKVIIAGVFSYPFDESWLGRTIDQQMIKELKVIAEKYSITLTGEGGELETFVCDAPFFSRKIEVLASEKVYKNYNGRYIITDAKLVAK